MTHQQPSNLLERISVDLQICHGKPCIKGTRIPVFVILDALAAGMLHREIIEEYPPITEEDIQAALYYASLVTQQEEVPLPA
jgi:uncharacterized protein (DUF433 family)